MSNRIRSFEEYKKEYQYSVEKPEEFWAEKASYFTWRKKWDKVLDWNFEKAETKWFIGGKLNITENCLDRHLATEGNHVAMIWEPNEVNEKEIKLTYKELHSKVCQFANVLKAKGVKKGDRVCLYMPMVPELMIAVLACARIGAIHSVVFAGFSASALADRIQDAEMSVVITSDGAYRGAKAMGVKKIVDEALEKCPQVKTVIVYKRTGEEQKMIAGRDSWWHEEIVKVNDQCPAEEMDAEDPLFILYTSGSTGKPKGVLHTTGGYMVYVDYSFRNVFQTDPDSIYWCTADIGWITGHSYLTYGPLLSGNTTIVFEGVPTYPDAGRFWQVIDKYKVTHFYTAPTAIRSLMGFGLDPVKPYKLDSLKVLGSVGEPINEEAWHWYDENIGKKKCPIVDTWWQTETGGILISPLAGITVTKPSYATLPLPGVQPVIVDNDGNELKGNGVEGNLCMKFPWPSIIRTTYGDHERCRQNYFSTYKNMYFTGDGCKRDEDGYYRILGRVDDVINVSGHRMGTAEVENAINEHEDVIESAVVGYPHDIKGQGIYAFVICEKNDKSEEALRIEITSVVNKIIGPIAKPDKIQIVTGLPKTRSGKIMRRILRKIAEGDVSNLGDTSTLLDPGVVEEIKNGALVPLKS
ncbi:MAG TPA: acetate--CoA ligase [Cytophagaceae bacterium]|nr:acetate--CoA ligase [Cytophagaceae bacterium]